MNKVGKYLLITILLMIGLFAVGLIYLFFVPNSELFGITYISYNNVYTSDAISSSHTYIELNSRGYEVNIKEASSDKISVKVYSNSLGFVLKKNSEIKIETIEESTVKVVFNITEPYGAAFAGSSYIDLFLPEIAGNYNLTLSNKSANTNINISEYGIKDLSYSTISGNLKIINATFQASSSLNLNIARSTTTIYNSAILNSCNVNLRLTSGKFDASDEIKLGDVNVLSSNSGLILIKECDTFTFNSSNAGGQVKGGTFGYTEINSKDTNVQITTLSEGASIILTGSGKATITEIKAVTSIETKSGEIYITKGNSKLSLSTNSGKITVAEAFYEVKADSSSGNVTVNFTTSSAVSRKFQSSTNNGNITVTGVNNADIKITGKGSLNMKMYSVSGINVVDSNNGNVYIEIPQSSSYTLTTQSSTGNVSVNLVQIPVGGYNTRELTTTPINGSTGTNTLSVKSISGSITIRDSVLA